MSKLAHSNIDANFRAAQKLADAESVEHAFRLLCQTYAGAHGGAYTTVAKASKRSGSSRRDARRRQELCRHNLGARSSPLRGEKDIDGSSTRSVDVVSRTLVPNSSLILGCRNFIGRVRPVPLERRLCSARHVCLANKQCFAQGCSIRTSACEAGTNEVSGLAAVPRITASRMAARASIIVC